MPVALSKLERHLFTATDTRRGKRGASEFTDCIFGIRFFKRWADVFEEGQQAMRGNDRVTTLTSAQTAGWYCAGFLFMPE